MAVLCEEHNSRWGICKTTPVTCSECLRIEAEEKCDANWKYRRVLEARIAKAESEALEDRLLVATTENWQAKLERIVRCLRWEG